MDTERLMRGETVSMTMEQLFELLNPCEELTSLRVGGRVRLRGAGLDGAEGVLLGVGDDGKAECLVDGALRRVAFHAIEHPRFDGFDVTEQLGRAFPSLKDSLAGGASARLERPIRPFCKPPVELPCTPGKLPPDTPRSFQHIMGATLDVADLHLTLTIWTILDDGVLASRVAGVERVPVRGGGERLVVAASMINFFDQGWSPDSPEWVARWVEEGVDKHPSVACE